MGGGGGGGSREPYSKITKSKLFFTIGVCDLYMSV